MSEGAIVLINDTPSESKFRAATAPKHKCSVYSHSHSSMALITKKPEHVMIILSVFRELFFVEKPDFDKNIIRYQRILKDIAILLLTSNVGHRWEEKKKFPLK
jgi:hypothetical protein